MRNDGSASTFGTMIQPLDTDRSPPRTDPLGKAESTGAADASGIREVIGGTGGASTQAFGTIKANSQVRKTGVFGVLVLTLQAHAYSWRFTSIDGSFTDSGTQATHS